MKRALFIFIIAIICHSLHAQETEQRGVTYRYNGKKARTPIGKVYIGCTSSTNAVLSDSVDGTFTLILPGHRIGDKIGDITIKKKGMIVFNKDAVREWSVRKEPLTLILCDADEFEKRKRELIGIGEREAKKRYDRRLGEIERKYKEESKEYYEKIAEIENELAEAQKRMNEYADVFARIDESEIDTLAQQAVELFYAGEVERAIELFEQGRYMEKIIEKRKRIKEREEVIAQLKENNIVDRETLEKNAETIMELAGMYKSSMELKEALKMYNDAMNIYERLSIADTLKYKESIDHIKVELESLEKNEKELQ